MNILFINTSKIWGGNEKWTHMAVHELAKSNNVSLAYRSKSLGEHFSVCRCKLPFLNRFDIYTLLKLIAYIKEKGIQVVVSTNRKFFLWGGIAARLSGCRHLVRCGIVWKVPDTKYYKFLFKNFIDGIIVNAQPVRSELAKSRFIDPQKIHLVYNGLDVEKLDQAKSGKVDKVFDFTVVSCGELVHRKGHDIIIKAFAAFLSNAPNTRVGLVIMGKGKQEEYLKKLATELGINDKVIFTGFLDNPYPLLCGADLFISASSNEGLANALLEAMYLELPVITTAAGGAGDIIEHGRNGFLVDRGNHEQLARLIEHIYLCDKEKLGRISKAGRRTILDRFSIERMAEELQRILLFGEKGGSRSASAVGH